LRVKEIYEILDRISPFEFQEEWDNSGLQLGDFNQEVEKIFISLDITSSLIEKLPPNSLLLTHHPLIFKKLSNLNYATYPSNLIKKLIQKNISLIALHTNFDKTHLNTYVARKVLGVEVEKCEGFVCFFKKVGSFEQIGEWVREKLNLPLLRGVKVSTSIESIALTTGSGGGLIGSFEADLFLSGDIKYHDALKAQEIGLNLLDIGHFESEIYFCDAMLEQLQKEQIEAIILDIKSPLKVF